MRRCVAIVIVMACSGDKRPKGNVPLVIPSLKLVVDAPSGTTVEGPLKTVGGIDYGQKRVVNNMHGFWLDVAPEQPSDDKTAEATLAKAAAEKRSRLADSATGTLPDGWWVAMETHHFDNQTIYHYFTSRRTIAGQVVHCSYSCEPNCPAGEKKCTLEQRCGQVKAGCESLRPAP